jgi:hypothetical protein
MQKQCPVATKMAACSIDPLGVSTPSVSAGFPWGQPEASTPIHSCLDPVHMSQEHAGVALLPLVSIVLAIAVAGGIVIRGSTRWVWGGELGHQHVVDLLPAMDSQNKPHILCQDGQLVCQHEGQSPCRGQLRGAVFQQVCSVNAGELNLPLLRALQVPTCAWEAPMPRVHSLHGE